MFDVTFSVASLRMCKCMLRVGLILEEEEIPKVKRQQRPNSKDFRREAAVSNYISKC